MNENTDTIQTIKDLIDGAKKIAIMPSKVAGADSFSAAAGLYYTLLQMDKDISFVYVGDAPKECEGLIDPEKLTDDIYARELHIAIDYSDTPASKLAYSNEEHVLNLVLSPISKDFDRSRIKTKIKGFDFDLIFVLGVQSPEDLGKVYNELREEFTSAKIVNIDNTNLNMNHGNLNIIDTMADNLSVIVFSLLSKLGIVPDGKAARSLLVGMSYREPQS